MTKSKFLKKFKANIFQIEYWGYLNIIVKKIKNKKVFEYWKKHGVPLYNGKPVDYDDLIVNPYFYEKCFQKTNFDDIYKAFVHCCCMSVDKDVPEYLNCLRAMKEIDD